MTIREREKAAYGRWRSWHESRSKHGGTFGYSRACKYIAISTTYRFILTTGFFERNLSVT